MQNLKNDSAMTVKFLRCITNHLSGRYDCRRIEYQVVIVPVDLPDFHYQYVLMYPEISVFPSVHLREESNRVSLLDHIIFNHFHDTLYAGRDKYGHILVKQNSLVSGTYIYQLSMYGKSRKWRKQRR